MCAKARLVLPGQGLVCGVCNKNGESRRWGSKMNSAGSTLRRLRTGNAKGMRPGQLIRYFLSEAFGDTDFYRVLLANLGLQGLLVVVRRFEKVF